jgi:hypothetical protein
MDSDGSEQMNPRAGTDSEPDLDRMAASTPESFDDSTEGGRTFGNYTMESDDDRQNIHLETGTTPLSMFAENRGLWYGRYPRFSSFFLVVD